MEGDLSLSQSLGGLRIANPDDSLAAGPGRDDNNPSPQHEQRSLHNNDPTLPTSFRYLEPSGGLPDPTTTTTTTTTSSPPSSSHLLAHPYPYPPHQDGQHHPPSRLPQDVDGSASTTSSTAAPAATARPSSTYLTSWSPPETSSTPATRAASYRMRAESGASSVSDNALLSDSRGGGGGGVGGGPAFPQRGRSVRDPVWDSTARGDASPYIPGSSAHGPVPAQRGSRVFPSSGASPLSLSGSPYGAEGGPLSSGVVGASGSGSVATTASAASGSATGEDWHERGAAVGLRQEVDSSGKTVSRYVKKGVRDFSFGRTLGEGSYSTVVAATDRQTLKEYAIKMLDKRHIIKEKKVKYVNIEKDTLNRLTDHPGVVRLYYTFQDERSLYFVIDLANGGELLAVLKRMQTFDEECTRFYAAQILDTVDYMHKRGVIHRDLKPENVLLDTQMHVKITDFGTAKILDPPPSRRPDDSSAAPGAIPHMGGASGPETSTTERSSSFVGTAEYVSPELLTGKNACKASDLWAFGCIVFQLLAGRPPFKSANEYQTFQKIVGLDYEFPRGFPPVARDLVERLLVIDPASRLQIEHIKNHEFFDGVTWGRGLWKQKSPRLKPYVPPPPEPIKLNGGPTNDDGNNGSSNNNMNSASYPPNINKMGGSGGSSAAQGTPTPTSASNTTAPSRPYPRVVTDLPPPSQLDIEWSPVLTRSNERILKLGNLTVSTSSIPGGSHGKSGGGGAGGGGGGDGGGNGGSDAPKKLSRFFGGATAKRRPRLVLVTTSGRVIVVAAGGEDKRPKLDISLLAPESQYRSVTDMKGHASWILDSRDKRYVFEETKSAAADGTAARSIQEWIDALDRARETAAVYATPATPFLGDDYDDFRNLPSGVSSHSDTLNQSDDLSAHHHHHHHHRHNNNNNHHNNSNSKHAGAVHNGGRNALVKHQHGTGAGGGESESTKGRKRFSRRQSKNGLSAIF